MPSTDASMQYFILCLSQSTKQLLHNNGPNDTMQGAVSSIGDFTKSENHSKRGFVTRANFRILNEDDCQST